MSANVLFADDDCDEFLAPLDRRLRKAGFNVTTALTYREAVQALEVAQGAKNTRIHSLLVDIILPFDRDGRGALMSDLGMKLANHAAALGVSAVAFLTVVRRDEVADTFADLERTYGDVRFGYFDKTDLLSRQELKNLIEFLGANGP
jgi:DNA-binding response OmpR family regulator